MEVSDAKPMHNLHPCYHSHFVHESIGCNRSGGERNWLASKELVMLSTRLLKSSSAEVTLQWAFTWNKYLYIIWLLRGEYSHTSFPHFLLIYSPILKEAFIITWAWSWISSHQNHENQIFIVYKPPSLWYLTIAAQMDKDIWFQFQH